MFNRIHSHKHKFFMSLRTGDGGFVKTAVLLLSSYALCVLANMLFHQVMELLARKTGNATIYVHALSKNSVVGKTTLVMITVLVPLLEGLLFQLSRWLARILFAVMVFLAIYLFTESLLIDHDSMDACLYLQTALAWVGAAGVYVCGPIIILRPKRALKIRCVFYRALGLLGLIQLGGFP
jgi:hypothetical protein